MLLTATSTSTPLSTLITNAGYSVDTLLEKTLTEQFNSKGVGIEILNKAGNTIYLENIFTATTTTSRPIVADESYSMDCRLLDNVNIITATTQQFYLTIV